MVYTVYTKVACPFCDKAKSLLQIKGYEYTEKNVGVEENLRELKETVPDVRTVPQIFKGNKHIGGYDDLVKYLGFGE